MSDDPAERLRQSNQVSIPAVLEIGDSDEATTLTAMMSDVAQIPVRIEWGPARAQRRGTGAGTIRAAEGAGPGGQSQASPDRALDTRRADVGSPFTSAPASAAPGPDSSEAALPGSDRAHPAGPGRAIAPIASRPRRYRARFIAEN